MDSSCTIGSSENHLTPMEVNSVTTLSAFILASLFLGGCLKDIPTHLENNIYLLLVIHHRILCNSNNLEATHTSIKREPMLYDLGLC